MIKILFVCHGNICRSTMAEFLFKYEISKLGLEKEFYVESAGTSSEEIGNPVHYGTRRILDRFKIDYSLKRARQIEKRDYEKFDYIIGMDEYNLRNLIRFFKNDYKHKISLLLDYTSFPRDVDDPWYSGDFEQTYLDIIEGINGILDKLNVRK